MRMNNPLVSIIVRTKDRPKLLKRALQSIAAQTYRPLEVVLVNDGGCDLDVEEIKTILGDVSLNYIRLEKNTGRAHAGNTGIENSKGEYISFLDDDDIYYTAAINSLMEFGNLRKDKTIYGKVVCKTYTGDDENSTVISEKTIGLPFDRRRLIFENFIPINSFIVPRYFFDKTGPFDSTFEIYEDWDWLIRLSAICEFSFIDIVIAEYSIFGIATITGKGGASLQNYYREKILQKHLQDVSAKDLLTYIQSTIDKIVLEKDERINELLPLLKEREATLAILKKDIEIKDGEIEKLRARAKFFEENIALRDDAIRKLDSLVKSLKANLEQKSEEMELLKKNAHELKITLQEILSSESWGITKPLRAISTALKKLRKQGL